MVGSSARPTWKFPGKLQSMQKKVFWLAFAALGLLADFTLPFWWAVIATFPVLAAAWWIAYRSDWF